MAAPVAIGVVFQLLGHPSRAVVMWALAAGVLVLVLAGVPVDRYLARLAEAIAHGVSVAATGAVGLLLIAGGGVVRAFGRDPLTPRSLRGNGWKPASSPGESQRLSTATFGMEHGVPVGGGARSAGRSLLLALGAITVLVLADLGVGLLWERVSSEATPSGQIVDVVNFTGRTDTVADIRAQSPAMAAYPWADAYFREIQLTPNSYWPFTGNRPQQFRGTYVTIDDWARASYTPAELLPDAPVLWMFGGSTTWGQGQRDGYTIASYLSRIAEAEGMPIRVMNYGQRGWTHFQEMVLFEQLLAEGPPPDMAIFYDGANEITSQTLGAKGVPTHVMVDQYADRISGGIAEEFVPQRPSLAAPSSASSAWQAYSGHSAIQKLVRRIRGELDPPAGASERPVDAGSAAPPEGEEEEPTDFGQLYLTTIDDAQRAVDVYERGRSLTGHLADEYRVTSVFFWQPTSVGPAEQWAIEHVSEPTIDISDTLEAHQEVYIDGAHTNEEGARIIAERIWDEIEPMVDELYVDGDLSRRASASTTTTAVPVMSNLDVIVDAAGALDDAAGDPCAVRRWSARLVRLPAATPEEVARLVALTQRFFGLLVASAPPEMTAEAGQVRSVIDTLPQIAEGSEIDPEKAFVPQLSVALDPGSGFVASVQKLVAADPASGPCD